jgi:hypothetical protein
MTNCISKQLSVYQSEHPALINFDILGLFIQKFEENHYFTVIIDSYMSSNWIIPGKVLNDTIL